MIPSKVLVAAYQSLKLDGPSSSLGGRTRRARSPCHERGWLKLQLPDNKGTAPATNTSGEITMQTYGKDECLRS
jgi:hypothetical protein